MQSEKKEREYHLFFMWGGLILFAIGICMPYLVARYRPLLLSLVGADSSDPLGTTGDWLGGTLTPVLTLAGNVLFFSAILLQREELKLQRKELEATRNEFKEQNKTMYLQRFESTFFNLLALHNEIVLGIKLVDDKVEVVGRMAFGVLYSRFLNIYNKTVSDNEIERIKIAYNNFFNDNHPFFSHYFRNLYRIVKFVDDTQHLSDEEKSNYCDIVRAQLSTFEIIMLGYNGLSNQGEKFFEFIRKYELIEDYDENFILGKTHFNQYKRSVI